MEIASEKEASWWGEHRGLVRRLYSECPDPKFTSSLPYSQPIVHKFLDLLNSASRQLEVYFLVKVN